MARTVEAEMDLRLEAAAAEELGENFAGEAGFRVPDVDWSRTAQRVLCIGWADGISIGDTVALSAAGHAPEDVLAVMARVFFQQVFRDGFFHGDLHPGNLFVDADGAVIAVDFGIMGRLDAATRRWLAEILLGFLTADYQRVAEVHVRAGYVPGDQPVEEFAQACRAIGAPILGQPLEQISLGRLLAQLFAVTERFHMETQPQLLLLQKTLLVAEGVGRQLCPHLNMWQLARPLIEEWMADHFGPEARVARAAADAVATIERLPGFVAHLDRTLDSLASHVARLDARAPEDADIELRTRFAGWPGWLAAGAAGALIVLLLA